MVSAEGLVDEQSNRVPDEGVVGELSNQGIAHTSQFSDFAETVFTENFPMISNCLRTLGLPKFPRFIPESFLFCAAAGVVRGLNFIHQLHSSEA